MYGSPAAARDLNLKIPAAPFKHGKEDPDLDHLQQQQQMNIGLQRYRSAPSSLLGEMCEDLVPHRSSGGAGTETLFTRLMSPDLRDQVGGRPPAAGGAAVATGQRTPQFTPDVENGAPEAARRHSGGLPSSASQMVYSAQQQQYLPGRPYRVLSSVAMDEEQQKGGVISSNLARHSSSPAGFFSRLSVESGYAALGGRGGLRPGTCSAGEATPADGRLQGQMSFPSRQSSSSGLMSQISEIEGESVGGSSPEDFNLDNGVSVGRCFIPGDFSVASWHDPALLSDGFSGSNKRARDPSDAQIGDVRCQVPVLSNHFSLPKTSSEMASILQFQDAVPCKIRAKRGCATHPRSIAERVRRTRISERMRRLQELVPNMDKQTNTADMLELAVEYIKELEKQVKSLAESRANCTCSTEQKP